MPADVPAFNPYAPWRQGQESAASNPARLVATPDRTQHDKQRELLEEIRQFVVFSDCLQDFVDHYWDLDHASAKLLREPTDENFSEVGPKLDLTVRDLGHVSKALVNGLGHEPDDAEKVHEYLTELQHLSEEILAPSDTQPDAHDSDLISVMRKICSIAEFARERAIAAYHDVNAKTQTRIAWLNQFFPEGDGRLGSDSIAQPSAILPAAGDINTRIGGKFQVSTQQFTRGISHDI